jgi:hypothetical protein
MNWVHLFSCAYIYIYIYVGESIIIRTKDTNPPGLLVVGCKADNLLRKTTLFRNPKKQTPDCPKCDDRQKDLNAARNKDG